MKITKIMLSAVALALLAGVLIVPVAEANTVGKAASDFTLKTHDDKSLTLSKLKGERGAVLVFFATWCPSCMAEVPQVKSLAAASRGKGVLVYGVNIRQNKRIIDRFIKDKSINYRILLDTDAKVAGTYGVRGIPTIIGIDTDGIVRYRGHSVPKDYETFIKLLTKPLKVSEAGDKL